MMRFMMGAASQNITPLGGKILGGFIVIYIGMAILCGILVGLEKLRKKYFKS